MFHKFVIFSVLVLLFCISVQSQICSKRRRYNYTSPVWNYEGRFKGYVMFIKEFDEMFCCEGYVEVKKTTMHRFYRDDEYDYSDFKCKSLCDPPCINGTCTASGECNCSSGYIPGANGTNICSPDCGNKCNLGTCIAPNTCLCDPGYQLVNDTCQPVCSEPCDHGFCDAPDHCTCLKGYIFIDSCQPYCGKGCDDGFICVEPETCVNASLLEPEIAVCPRRKSNAADWLEEHWLSFLVPVIVVLVAALIMWIVRFVRRLTGNTHYRGLGKIYLIGALFSTFSI